MFLRIKTTPDSSRRSVHLSVRVGGSVLKHKPSGRRYVVPSKPTPNMEKIHETMGIALSATPYELD